MSDGIWLIGLGDDWKIREPWNVVGGRWTTLFSEPNPCKNCRGHFPEKYLSPSFVKNPRAPSSSYPLVCYLETGRATHQVLECGFLGSLVGWLVGWLACSEWIHSSTGPGMLTLPFLGAVCRTRSLSSCPEALRKIDQGGRFRGLTVLPSYTPQVICLSILALILGISWSLF